MGTLYFGIILLIMSKICTDREENVAVYSVLRLKRVVRPV